MRSFRLSQWGQFLGRRLALQLSLLTTALFTCLAFGALYFHADDEVTSYISGQTGNFSYWMTVGDTFQIQRALKGISENPFVTSVHLVDMASGVFVGSAESVQRRRGIPFRRDFEIGKGAGHLAVAFVLPVTPFLWSLVAGLVTFIGCSVFFRSKALALTEEISAPMDEFFAKTTKASSVDDLKKLDVGASRIFEIRQLARVIREMGERIIAERKIRVDERREFIFKVTRQVAHDIRSPLSALRVISEKKGPISDSERKLIEMAAIRIGDIAKHVLDVAKEEATINEIAPVKAEAQECTERVTLAEIQTAIEETIALKRAEFGGQPTLEHQIRLEPTEREVIGSKSILSRILSNLINNSKDATDSLGGKIIISAELSGQDVIVDVRDNGRGIPDDILNDIGREGISTKQTLGHGYGLWFARSTLAAWRGRLKIYSKSGSGTTVSISLPVV